MLCLFSLTSCNALWVATLVGWSTPFVQIEISNSYLMSRPWPSIFPCVSHFPLCFLCSCLSLCVCVCAVGMVLPLNTTMFDVMKFIHSWCSEDESYDYGDTLTFPLVPTWGCIFVINWNVSTTIGWIAMKFVQVPMMPRGWILNTLMILWVFNQRHQQV